MSNGPCRVIKCSHAASHAAERTIKRSLWESTSAQTSGWLLQGVVMSWSSTGCCGLLKGAASPKGPMTLSGGPGLSDPAWKKVSVSVCCQNDIQRPRVQGVYIADSLHMSQQLAADALPCGKRWYCNRACTLAIREVSDSAALD